MGTHPIFESDFDCLTDMKPSIEILTRLKNQLSKEQIISQGAEAKIYKLSDNGTEYVVKERFSKCYRVKELDESLRRKHTQAEVKALQKCAKFNIPSPKYFESIPKEGLILVEYLNGVQLKELIDDKKVSREEIGKIMGEIVGKVHARGVCHGDLTTSNFMKSESKYYIIDFGLSQMTDTDENRAVDLHVLEKQSVQLIQIKMKYLYHLSNLTNLPCRKTSQTRKRMKCKKSWVSWKMFASVEESARWLAKIFGQQFCVSHKFIL